MSFEVITYATHSERMFPELRESGYPVKVLGWGDKWEGFHTKIKGVLEYVKTKRPDDIVVCIDAFDTRIMREPSESITLFRDMNCGFLVSEDIEHAFDINHVKFGTCMNNKTANMGLWMGYVKYIIPILEDILKRPCDDDQINFNSLCNDYDFIKMDTQRNIFHNTANKDTVSDSIFLGFPASENVTNTIKRFFIGSLPFFLVHITLMFYILYTLFPNFKIQLGTVYSLLFIIFLFKSNKKCYLKK